MSRNDLLVYMPLKLNGNDDVTIYCLDILIVCECRVCVCVCVSCVCTPVYPAVKWRPAWWLEINWVSSQPSCNINGYLWG